MSEESEPKQGKGWPEVASDFIKSLPTGKLTAAHTLNALADGMGLACIAVVCWMPQSPSSPHVLGAFPGWLVFAAWCFIYSRLRR